MFGYQQSGAGDDLIAPHWYFLLELSTAVVAFAHITCKCRTRIYTDIRFTQGFSIVGPFVDLIYSSLDVFNRRDVALITA
jgi:hypothetical protein